MQSTLLLPVYCCCAGVQIKGLFEHLTTSGLRIAALL